MSFNLDALVIGPCVKAFGEKAQGYPAPVYIPAGGLPFPIDGVYDDAYHEIDRIAELPVSGAVPMLGVRLSDFPPGVTPKQGDQLQIRGRSFLVREERADGHGWTRLLLNLAS